MNYKIKYISSFAKELKRLGKKYRSMRQDYARLLEELHANPTAGVSLGRGVRKVRMAIASKNKRHLHSLASGYLGVRIKAGRRLTGNDASILQVLYVALRPVAGDVGERRGYVFVSGSVVVTVVADGVNHFRHLRAGYRAVRLKRTILIALDDTKGREQIHGFGVISIDIRRIRECRTGKHGERASERQHQCENLFEMLCPCT